MKKILSAIISLAIILSCLGCVSFTYAEEGDYYFSDMTGEDSLNGAETTLSNRVASSFKVDEDGTDYLKFEVVAGEGATGYNYLTLPLMKNTDEVKKDVVYEIRMRTNFNAESFVTSTNSNHTFMQVGTSVKNAMYRPSVEIGTASHNVWNTYTVVFKADEGYREIYLNGTKLADTGAGTDEQGYLQNIWNYNGQLAPKIWIYLKNIGYYADIDYIRIYKKTESFTASVKNAENASPYSLEVSFDAEAVFGADEKGFVLSDGTAISSVEKLENGSYKIVPERALKGGTEYTLSFNVTDSLGRKPADVRFKTIETVDFTPENVFYYNDFTTSDDTTQVIQAATSKKYLTADELGNSVLRIDGTTDQGTYSFKTPVVTPAGKPVVAVEMRLRMKLGDYGFIGSYQSDAYCQAHGNSKAFAMGGYGYKNSIRFDRNAKESITKEAIESEYNTITVIYDNVKNSRDIYLNGKYVATSPEGTYENYYATNGSISAYMLAYMPSKAEGLGIDIDYIKIYEPVKSLSFEVENPESVSPDAITLNFNSTVNELDKSQISLSGNVEFDVLKKDENSFILIPATALAENKEYVLTLSGVKDIFGNTASGNLVINTGKKTEAKAESVLYFSDLGSEASLDGLTTQLCTRNTVSYGSDSDGTDYIKVENIAGADASGYSYINIPEISNTEAVKPDVAYEIRMRTSFNGNSFVTTKNTSHSFMLVGTNIKYGMYKPESELGNIGAYSYNTWNTYTVVYHAEKGYRSIYMNGKLLGEGLEGADTQYGQPNNPWYKNGKLNLSIWLYLQNAGHFTDIDYIKVYTLENPAAEIVNSNSVEPKAIEVDFTGNVSMLSASQISIDGVKAAKVTLKDKKNSIWEILPGKVLKASKEYKLAVADAKDNMGNSVTGVYAFTTAAKDDVTVNAEAGEGGAVSFASTTLEYADDFEFTVTPDFGYLTEKITVNGKEITVNAKGNYTLKGVTENTVVSVSFVKDETEPYASAHPAGVFNESVTTAYAFGKVYDNSLDYTVVEFGMLLAKTEADLEGTKVIKIPAEEKTGMKPGIFGIKIIDQSFIYGGNYCLKPYTVVKSTATGEETVKYGEVIKVNIHE